jgi:hypothetical protein
MAARDTPGLISQKKSVTVFYWIGNQQGAPAIQNKKALLQVLTGNLVP